METFTVKSGQHTEFIDITSSVQKYVAASGIQEGVCHVFTPHTTAAVTINENADPAVLHDLAAGLEHTLPWRTNYYRHGEGNSAAHMKSSMFGCEQAVLVTAGRLVLGTWQSIFFCEFDGPRTRKVHLQVIGSGE